MQPQMTVQLAVTPAHGSVMLAELDGRPVAAMAMADGRLVGARTGLDPAIVLVLHIHRLAAGLVGRIWGG
jgi:hypothetical protein